MTHLPRVRVQLGTVSQCAPYHCALGVQEVINEEWKNDVRWVAEATGLCPTTSISKDSKQKSSGRLNRIYNCSVLLCG